jgi:hypothetical protein
MKQALLIRLGMPILLFGILILFSARRYINPQEDVEAKLARDLTSRMKIYDVMSTNTPVTNLYQLFPNARFEPEWYPHRLHDQLLDFGKNAGFKTSVVEKYVFFWPRLTHSKLHGQVICMSAKPFPDVRGGPSRIYISFTGETYTKIFVPEDFVQGIFRETKPSIAPLPPIKPPPPSPFANEFDPGRPLHEFARNLSGALGQDDPLLGQVIVYGGTIIIIFVCALFIHRHRRPER